MSKELTEQWRNGTLPDNWYYIVLESKDLTGIDGCTDGVFWHTDDKIIEVLANVPTYDHFVDLTEKANQFSQMVKKVERLEQLLESETLAKQEGVELVAELEYRLKEAEEVILLYFKNTQNATYQSLGMNDGYYKKAFIHTVAKEYLEKYGVKNDY